MSRPPPAPSTSASPESRFRGPIQSAVASGLAVEDMRLRLTLRDTQRLIRDPAVAVADISYAGGVMRFLGVRVEQGGVAASVLELGT